MEPRRTSVRRAALVGTALALVLGASACTSGPMAAGPAATVNGVEITRAEVTDLTTANIRFYEQAGQLGQDESGELAALAQAAGGTGTDTQSMTEATSALEALINAQLIRGTLAKEDALPSKDELAAVRTELETSVGGAEKLKEFDEDFIAFAIESRALTAAYKQLLADEADKDNVSLTPEQREEQMRELYEATAPTQPLCLNAIQLQTEEEADAARARVDGGEAFGAVAEDLAPEGIEVPEGGFAACLSFEQAQTAFGTDFTDATVGQLYGPVPYSQEGSAPIYLVLEVDGLEGPTYEQLLPQLEEAVPAEPTPTDPTQVDIAAPLAALYAKADISIDPMYGTWNDRTGRITPPRVPGATTTAPLVAPVAGS